MLKDARYEETERSRRFTHKVEASVENEVMFGSNSHADAEIGTAAEDYRHECNYRDVNEHFGKVIRHHIVHLVSLLSEEDRALPLEGKDSGHQMTENCTHHNKEETRYETSHFRIIALVPEQC